MLNAPICNMLIHNFGPNVYTVIIMLKLAASLINQPLLSIRTAGPVATTESLIINPNNLKIEGFYCIDRYDKSRLVLVTIDIREILPPGIVINDHSVLSEVADLIRLRPIIDLNFILIGKRVVTESGQKVGRIIDFAADSKSLYIQKLYVGQSLFKNFSGGQLAVDRSQIVSISDREIVIQDLENFAKNTAPATTAPA